MHEIDVTLLSTVSVLCVSGDRKSQGTYHKTQYESD